MAPAGEKPQSWHFYNVNSAPRTFDIVLCRFPFEEDPKTPPLRRSPCIVRRVRVNSDETAAYVTVAFGTTNLLGMERLGLDLIVQNAAVMHKLGLAKATRFDLSAKKTAELPWCEEWFPLPHGRMTPKIGSLDRVRIEQLLEAVDNRKKHGQG